MVNLVRDEFISIRTSSLCLRYIALFLSPLFLLAVDAQGVISNENPGGVRLAGSSIPGQGRLEIHANSAWSTICDDDFGPTEARLACNQLGFRSYSNYGSVRSLGYPEGSSSAIWNVSCNSFSERAFSECSRNSVAFCSHIEDVALQCSQPYQTESGSLRLVSKDGTTSESHYLTAGRVEIFYAGQWGTICDDRFSSTDAAALCSNLTGSSSVLTYGTVTPKFDQGSRSSPVWIEDLRCTYSTLSERYNCTHNGIGIHNCSHSEDVYISCRADGAVRLISSFSTPSNVSSGGSAGRLEIYYNGQWGTVCDNFFGQNDADVVCKQLGYSRGIGYGNVVYLGYYSGSSLLPIWLTKVGCTSSDVFLANCSHSGFGNTLSCSHREDVAVTCSTEVAAVRLSSLFYTSPSSSFSGGSSGRLEIYYNGQWGTVCDNFFSQTDADVVCNQLGYDPTAFSYGNVAMLGYSRGSSSSPIWLTNVSCTSRDTSLASCSHSGFGNTAGCSHSDDVAVSCSSSGSKGGGGVGVFIETICSVGFNLLVLCCCCIIWFCIAGCSKKSRSTITTRHHASPPPRTTVVTSSSNSADASNSRPTQPTAALVMTSVGTPEAFVVNMKETAPPSYSQAQTYVGEAPPDYNTACNYPKADHY